MTARIFIGTSANNEDLESCLVLEHTLRKHSSIPLDITFMRLSRDPDSPFYSDPPDGWNIEKWATPFSALRWGIPAYCEFEGRAIYFDSDFIVRADIAELWNTPFKPGKLVIAKGQGATQRYCCSLWDCTAWKTNAYLADWALARMCADPDTHQKLTRYFASHQELVQPFEGGDWNVLDINLPADLTSPNVKALHYTRVDQQLHLKYAVPRLMAFHQKHWYPGTVRPNTRPDLQALFDAEYADAMAAGASLESYQVPLYGSYANPRLRGP